MLATLYASHTTYICTRVSPLLLAAALHKYSSVEYQTLTDPAWLACPSWSEFDDDDGISQMDDNVREERRNRTRRIPKRAANVEIYVDMYTTRFGVNSTNV